MRRVLLLLPTSTYKTASFLSAAANLGLEIVVASEETSTLAAKNPEGLLTLDFNSPASAACAVADFAGGRPLDAVIPVDEVTAVIAAHIADSLGLPQNPIAGAEAARNKYLMRESLRRAGLPVPRYWHFTLDDDLHELANTLSYPCVVKPVSLSTSRGVIRADDPAGFVAAVARINSILTLPHVKKRGGAAARELLAEEFIPGVEIAIEALLDDEHLEILTIFDKPDPLNGPFFEETIYVTPSRLPERVQDQASEATLSAARAMGLVRGPIHAELRINDRGPWVVEVAARCIGGLCSRSLRFNRGLSLEEIVLMHAAGLDTSGIRRETLAAGVMMIPIPRAGTLRAVTGLDEARTLPGIEDIVITAHITQEIAPPPEGSSYLGFIFSRAATPGEVEMALRQAHAQLSFEIEPAEAQSASGQTTSLRSRTR